MGKILVLGTLDTKGTEIWYLRKKILDKGHFPVVMDLSMGEEAAFKGDITPSEILARIGRSVDKLRESNDRYFVTQIMTEAASIVVKDLVDRKKVDGIIAIGGVTLTTIASKVMQVCPFGFPKVIGVTAAMPAYIREWYDAMDVVIMQTIVDFAGLNPFVQSCLNRLAGIICGMVEGCEGTFTFSVAYP